MSKIERILGYEVTAGTSALMILRSPRFHSRSKPVYQVGVVALTAYLVVVLVGIFVRPTLGQQVYMLYGSVDGDELEAFSRRGVPVDIVTNPFPTVPVEDDVSEEVFREVASKSLVALYDSLQVGTELWAHVDDAIAGNEELRQVTFLLLEDSKGLEPDIAGRYATVERNGSLHLWPTTNLFGYFVGEEVVVVVDEGEGRTCFGEDCVLESPKIRITDSQTEPEHLRNLRSQLDEELAAMAHYERFIDEINRKVPALVVEGELADVAVAEQRAIAEKLGPALEAHEEGLKDMVDLDESFSMQQDVSDQVRQSLIVAGVPAPPRMQMPRYVDQIRGLRKEVARLSQETAAAEAETAIARRNRRVLGAQLARLRNMLVDLNAELAQHRRWADDLRRVIADVESGHLDLTRRQTELVLPNPNPRWYFDAEILVGSTLASELEERLGRKPWSSVLVHRAFNTRILTEDQARARFYKDRTSARKVGWSEIALFGKGFELSEILDAEELAFENGAGLFLSAVYAEALFDSLQSFFSKKGPKYIWPLAGEGHDDLSEAIGSGGTRTVAVYEHLTPLARETHRIGDVSVGKIDWWSVPATDLLHTASTTAGLLSMLYHGWHDSDAIAARLLEVTSVLWGTVEYHNVVTLAQVMSHFLQVQGWPEATNDPAATKAIGLIPLAYLDALTNFGLDEAALFPEHVFEDFRTPEALPQYFSRIRPALVSGFDRTDTSVQTVPLDVLARRINDYLVCAVDASSKPDATAESVSSECWPSEAAGP